MPCVAMLRAEFAREAASKREVALALKYGHFRRRVRRYEFL